MYVVQGYVKYAVEDYYNAALFKGEHTACGHHFILCIESAYIIYDYNRMLISSSVTAYE